MSIKSVIAITFVLFFGVMHPAMSEYYVGVDYYAFDTSMKNGSFNTGFYGNQQRIRAGYRVDHNNIGFELNFLSEQDDTNASGYLNYKVGPSYGAYVYLYDKWIYCKFGALVSDTTLKNVPANISQNYSLWQFSASIGLQFEIIDHVFLNADYTYSNGSGDYSNIVGSDDPKVTTQAFAAGITLGF